LITNAVLLKSLSPQLTAPASNQVQVDGTVAFKKPTGGELADIQQTYDEVHNGAGPANAATPY
jgi:hypothetical protein